MRIPIIKVKPLKFLLVIFLSSCHNKQLKKDFIIEEKDLIPEGMAVDSRTNGNYYYIVNSQLWKHVKLNIVRQIKALHKADL